ncbi:hypothetical protein SAMN06264849_103171 [Melghirimyces algeriensis]|uniref:Molecular chaperone DnaJ n=1 Tax=Melghirimyces algeriensis TaxID=910412 RepID=A0A521C7J9_9BACL|nr:hypothetical protein SAMN06264849_103171 [Melghirimyces algeriensis]
MVTCSVCKGKGKIKTMLPIPMETPCAYCGGTGRKPKQDEIKQETFFDRLKKWFLNR